MKLVGVKSLKESKKRRNDTENSAKKENKICM